MNPDDFREDIAHICDGENVFQVLNESKDDWDEEATRLLYNQHLVQQGLN